MPYVEQDRRKFLASQTYKQLLDIADTMHIGDINFLISNLLWVRFNKNRSYKTANELLGVLEAAKLELYQRQIIPYEAQKQSENGDLDV